MTCISVLLPDPFSPTRPTQLAGTNLQRRAAQDLDAAPMPRRPGREGLRDAVDREHRLVGDDEWRP